MACVPPAVSSAVSVSLMTSRQSISTLDADHWADAPHVDLEIMSGSY